MGDQESSGSGTPQPPAINLGSDSVIKPRWPEGLRYGDPREVESLREIQRQCAVASVADREHAAWHKLGIFDYFTEELLALGEIEP